MISPWRKWRFHVHGDLMDKYWYMWLIMDSMIVGAASWWKTWRIDCIDKKWWTNGEWTRFWKWGIHQEIELAVPIVVVWVQTSRTHLDRSSLFPSLVTPLRKSSSLLKYVPQKNCQCIIAGDLGPSETTAQPLLLSFSCHGGLCVSWARDWGSRGENSSPKSSFYKSSTAINDVGYPIFQTTSKIPTKKKEIPSAEPMKDAIATWSSWRMSQVSQKVAWLMPACPKIRVSDLSFTNTQSCSERISIDIHGMWRRHKKTTTLQYCNKYWAAMVSQFI